MDWRQKRRRDLLAQKKYAEDHSWCEICLAEGRGKRRVQDVHEILFRSLGGKCVPENEISTCRPDHDRAHRKRKPYLTRNKLFEIKKGEKVGAVV